ncbi:MAG TPA: hypothetical protein VFM02_01945 [Candidatus Paceibacterota bacterium]|nr:hypothetical protein [Candidatus Paceibacterota bacterium]
MPEKNWKSEMTQADKDTICWYILQTLLLRGDVAPEEYEDLSQASARSLLQRYLHVHQDDLPFPVRFGDSDERDAELTRFCTTMRNIHSSFRYNYNQVEFVLRDMAEKAETETVQPHYRRVIVPLRKKRA